MDGLISSLVLEWLNLAFRWVHVVAAIAWIGASFYFIWLDLSLREPPQWKIDKGVKGDLWAIHGGGIYEVAKYHLRPQEMPVKLHWFKWEAYSTWLTGTGLLILMYYLQAQTYLVGHNTLIQSPGLAIIASVTFILGGQLIYELLLRTPLVKRGLVIAAALLTIITLASYVAHQLFSARAAYLHVGAMIATWMAGNVFWGIMPAQRKFVAAVSNNEAPDTCAMAFAKLRSTHNNYLTLPVIFCMLSNHYSFLYSHAYSWLVLVAICVCLAWGRHFFNLKHLGVVKPVILVTSLLGIIAIAIIMSVTASIGNSAASNSANKIESDLQSAVIDDAKITQLVQVHCANCHSTSPSQPGFNAAPAGLIIDSATQLQAQKIRALPALYSGYMPLGNFHQLTELERKSLIDWLNTQ
ncbi:MAG TPA: urate hydroxylase PuuD [Cellvibrio sp.]|nr:urate hydroxylase PuuD [Cellvibrio sp.]